jgi:hypothetical protein
VSDIVSNRGHHERKHVHGPQELSHPSLGDRPIPPPLPPPFPDDRIVVFFTEEMERRGESHADEEGVARLCHVCCVCKVVVGATRVVGGAEGEEEGLESICGCNLKSVEVYEGWETKGDAPWSNSTPSMLRTLSKMSPTQLSSSSGV